MQSPLGLWPWAEEPASLRRWALFLDVDGTLLDLAGRPDQVAASPALVETLSAVSAALGGAVALVSGRRIEELDRIFQPLRLAAAGVHGASLRRDPDAAIVDSAPSPLLATLKPRLAAFVAGHPGCLLEDKGASLAVHYRAVPEAGRALDALVRPLVAATAGRVAIGLGQMVTEVRTPGLTKGTAIRTLLTAPPFAGRFPVFAGDDVTDQDGFDAVLALGGQAIQVGDTPGVAAPVRIADPPGFRTWLTHLARTLDADR